MTRAVHRPSPIRPGVWVPVVAAWIGVVTFSLWALAGYDLTPGDRAAATPRWPTGVEFELAPTGLTLVMTLHPRCPCSLASIDQLAEIVREAGESGPHVTVLIAVPEDADSSWTERPSVLRVRAIPGVQLIVDPGGVQSGRLGARTSGQVYLYNAAGSLLFEGGITGARGHAGDNLGARAVSAGIRGEAVPAASAPVYGCPLAGTEAACGTAGDCEP